METALMLSGQPVKRGTMAHDHDVYMALTDSATQQDDAAGIERYAPLLQELAQRDHHKLYLAIALRARGVAQRLAANYDDAEKFLLRALEIFDALGTRWQCGCTLVELGELERARNNAADACDYLTRALFEFDVLRAEPDAERVRAALQEVVE